jgi:hypothetical protein
VSQWALTALRYLREVVCPALSAPQQPQQPPLTLFFSNGNTATSNFGSNPQNPQTQAANIFLLTDLGSTHKLVLFGKALLQYLQEKIQQTKMPVMKI